MERAYIIDHPMAPLEPAGVRHYGSGTTRTVTYVNDVKVVVWDYANDRLSA